MYSFFKHCYDPTPHPSKCGAANKITGFQASGNLKVVMESREISKYIGKFTNIF